MKVEFCERCGEPLRPESEVWLELNWRTNKFSKVGTVPEEESQGCFVFGPDCAKHPNKPYRK